MLFLYKSELLNKIRLNWKEPSSKWREFSEIKTLFQFTCLKNNKIKHEDDIIDDKTWNDLNMNSVFSRVDSTSTSIGQQYLYRKMRLLKSNVDSLKDDYHIAKKIQHNQNLREKLQLTINPLSGIPAKNAVKIIFGEFPLVSLPKTAIIVWILVSVLALYYSLQLNGGLFSLLLPTMIIITNFFLSQYFQKITEANAFGLFCVEKLLCVSHTIANEKHYNAIPECCDLISNRSKIIKIKHRLQLITFSQSNNNALIGNLMYLINLIVIYDLFIYAFFMTTVYKNLNTIKICFNAIGSIDTNIAIASYIEHYPKHCNPTFLKKNIAIDLKNAYHPLLDNCVKNSYRTKGESALITGSNMAGKTTFIRTVGINLILASARP